MQIIISLFVIILVISIVLALLPIILPIVLIFIAAIAFFAWRTKRKFMEHMNDYEQDGSGFQRFTDDSDTQYTYDANASGRSDDVIDVEFTEREE